MAMGPGGVGDVLYEASIHPWGVPADDKKSKVQGNWFKGTNKKSKMLPRKSRMGENGASVQSMQWMLPKMVVVLLETKLGLSTLVAQSLERTGIQTVYTASSVQEIQPLLVEAQACAKFVTLVCHADSSDEVNSNMEAYEFLASDEMASSIGCVCLLPNPEIELMTPDSVEAIEAFDGAAPPQLIDQEIATGLMMPYTQIELMSALCCNHELPESAVLNTLGGKEVSQSVLLLSADLTRRRALHESLERALVTANSCSLNPDEVVAWMKVCIFDCIVAELPIITDVYSRRRSWWKFAEEAGEEPTAPGTISVDEAGAISVSDTPGSMGGVPGLEAVAAPAVENHVQAAEAIELLEVVQMAAGSTGAVPVVVVTSNVNVETQKLLTDSGAAKIVSFPCNEKLLLATVSSAANGRSPSTRSVTRKPTQLGSRKGTNKNKGGKPTQHGNKVTSTDGASRPTSMIQRPKHKMSARKGSRGLGVLSEKTALTEATLRGMYLNGFTSLSAESGVACGVMRGATHHTPQDRMMILENFGAPGWTFIGCFDGHGPDGHYVSQFMIETLPTALLIEMDQEDATIPTAIKITCQLTKEMLDSSEVDASSSGSTAVFAVCTDDNVYVGNVGDSRAAILCSKPGGCCRAPALTGEPLTDDHKPESASEAARVRAAGGLCMQMGPVMRVVQQTEGADGAVRGLAMTRSFGDCWAENIGVTADPDVYIYKRSDHDRYLVVGSDGIWDMMTEQEVADWFTQAEKAGTELTRAVQGLVEEAVNRWTSQGMQADDTSLVVLAI